MWALLLWGYKMEMLSRCLTSTSTACSSFVHGKYWRNISNPRRELKIRRAAENFWRNSRCLDSCLECLSSQLKQKLRSQQRSKIVKIYANQDRVSKLPSWLWFSLFNLMNYDELMNFRLRIRARRWSIFIRKHWDCMVLGWQNQNLRIRTPSSKST